MAPAAAVAGVAPLDLAAVQKLSSIADVHRLLHEANARERSIDGELEQLLSRRGELEQGLAALHTSTTEMLQVMRVEAEQLAAGSDGSAALAAKVSRKVRELDTAQSRVQATLARIGAVVERVRAVEGLQAALGREDWGEGAQCVARYLELSDEQAQEQAQRAQEQQQDGGGGGSMEPLPPPGVQPLLDAEARQAQEQAKALAAGRIRLEQVVRTKGREAAAAGDHAAVLRFTRLCKPLRIQQEGVDLLTGFLRSLISDRAKQDYAALVDSHAAGEGARPDYLGALTNLFRDVAAAVDEHLELVEDVFGPDLGLAALLAVHTECDVHGTRLLQRYADYRRLARIAGQVGMRRRDDTTAEAAPVEPRQVEAFLEELLLLCGRGEEYTQYLLARMGEVTAPAPLPPARETALRGGAFSAALRELLSYYISLEEYYAEEAAAKAIRIDEAMPGALTSSMVDDAFFVLLKAGRRALATGKAPSAVAILNTLGSLLSTLYRGALAARLQGAPAKLLAAAPAEPGAEPGPGAAAAAVALNNADVSATYVGKLREQLEALAGQQFGAANDRDRVKLVLADLGKTGGDFKALAGRCLEQLVGGIMPRLRPVLDSLGGASYELGEGDFGAAEEGWPVGLVLALQAHAGWLQPLLTGDNWEALLGLLVERVAERVEAVLSQKRFTQLGGLTLERQLRTLLVGLSDLTSRSLRDKFARLSQVGTVLALESAGELLDYWGDAGTVAWRLSEADVRQVLAQRVDFAPGEIAALRL